MHTENKEIAEEIKCDVIHAIRGTGQTLRAVSDTISVFLAGNLEVAGKTGTSVTQWTSDVVRGALQAVLETGGNLTLASRGIALGVLRGSGNPGPQTLETIAETAAKIVKCTEELLGDSAQTAKGAVEGSIMGAKEMGLNLDQAAQAAASGVLIAAQEISSETSTKVQKAVTGMISGVPVSVKELTKTMS